MSTSGSLRIGNAAIEEQESLFGRYVIYIFGVVIVTLVFILFICYLSRKRNLMQARNRILLLRAQCRPENIVRAEIESSLRSVKHKSKDAKEKESCAICCDDFKQRQALTQTECNHQFHESCLWKWIDTKLKQTMSALQQQHLENPEQRLSQHPPKDCVECPLCNQPMIKTSEDERKDMQTKILRQAQETQASFIGVSQRTLLEMEARANNAAAPV